MKLINEIKENFTMLPNYILQQRNISLKAIGLYSKLSSFPNNWKFTEEGLCSVVKDGKDSVKSAIKELEDLNLFLRFRARNENGTLGETIFYVSPVPLTEEGKNKIKSRFCLETTIVQPMSENPMLEKPMLENPEQYNTNIYNIKNNNICSSAKNEKNELQELCESLYQDYPKHKGKADAIKHIKALLNGTKTFNGKKIKLSAEQICTAICNYENEIETKKISEEYILYASTFFNNRIFDYLE